MQSEQLRRVADQYDKDFGVIVIRNASCRRDSKRLEQVGNRVAMALGARRADVLQMTVKDGLKLVCAGMLLGVAAAFILTRVMSTLLYGISATDPITFVGISFVLLAVAMLASYVPALRATKVDPIIALRAQ